MAGKERYGWFVDDHHGNGFFEFGAVEGVRSVSGSAEIDGGVDGGYLF